MEFLAEFHPKVIHFPIAFFLLYILLETIGTVFKKEFFSKAAHLLLFFGVLGALAAVLTGEQAYEAFEYWNKASEELVEAHENFATITLWYFTGLLVLRTFVTIKKKFSGSLKYVFVLLAAVGGYFVFKTGDLGGQMVYKHGAGTEYKIKIMEAEE
ncbi:MAG: DUF2231 domain-containing protein [Ignavibacteriales bacterium]|nr:MAG: DUF2231 domain-containing protein [Ignavibacteriales bacterium]